MGRLPVLIGKSDDGFCISFESFAYHKLGFRDEYELGPGEIVLVTPDEYRTISPAGDKMKICAFLWVYYGYPNSNYEGVNVEVMRYRNGAVMARDEAANTGAPALDYVAGVPDSGVPHAIGYATECKTPFARPFIKYTPTWARSFMPSNQEVRNRIAKMKQIHIPELSRIRSCCSWTIPSCAARSCARPWNSSTSAAPKRCTCARPARPSCSAAST